MVGVRATVVRRRVTPRIGESKVRYAWDAWFGWYSLFAILEIGMVELLHFYSSILIATSLTHLKKRSSFHILKTVAQDKLPLSQLSSHFITFAMQRSFRWFLIFHFIRSPFSRRLCLVHLSTIIYPYLSSIHPSRRSSAQLLYPPLTPKKQSSKMLRRLYSGYVHLCVPLPALPAMHIHQNPNFPKKEENVKERK